MGLLTAAEPAAALSLLLPALKDADADLRAAVLSALAVIPDDPRVAAAISASLGDRSPTVVSAAARAAAQRHDPALGAAVLATLNQAGSKVSEPAAAGKAPTPGKGRPADDQSVVLASLAEAAAELHPEGAAGALANLLANPAADVRVAAAHALGKLKDATALNSLLNGLQDKDASAFAAVIGALGESDAPEAIQAVLDALAKPTLTPELRRQILTRLAAHCSDPSSPYGSWAQTGPALKDADLDILVSMAPAATAPERQGLIALAGRYLIEPRLEAKKHAGSILGNYPDDETVRTTLLKAIEQDNTGIVPATAEVLRRIRDDSMIEAPLLAYYKALCEGAAATAPAYVAPPRPATPSGSGAAMPGRRGRSGETAAPATPPPTPAALAPLAPQYPGLAKATPEESALLRAAIIEALGSIGGDHAGKALRTVAELEQRRNSDEMTPNLIAAFERAKAPNSVRDLCQFYVIPAGRYRLDAVGALKRMVSLDSERAKETLQRLVAGALTPPDVAAAAADALDEIQSAGGA
jgi:HEAT repeat protein